MSDREFEEQFQIEVELLHKLGVPGRLVGASKTLYLRAHPNNRVIFNANLCLDGEKVWYGDIDLTRDEAVLRELSCKVTGTLQVLRESDARFDNEESPLIERAVATLEAGEMTYNEAQW